MRRSLLFTVCLMVASASTARAQDPYNLTAPVQNLATLFTNIFGPRGLLVDSEAALPGDVLHTAHFNNDFQSNFGKFSTAMVSQFVAVPLPSPASGFTYQFDPSTGVFQRSTQSFGPILSERAETVGARRVSFGFAAQRFTFDTVEGLDLGSVPAVFTHDNAQLRGGREDVVTTDNAITTTVGQYTTFVTIGVTDRFDVSLAVPLVSTYIKVVSHASIHRLGTTNPATHFYRQADGTRGTERFFTAIGDARGLGDITVRAKGSIVTGHRLNAAIGADVRLPTGDELNLLGTGTAAVAPFLVLSTSLQRVAPHLNASYQWNGSSVLAGNPATGVSADFPDQALYSIGADVSANDRLTLAFDVLGRYLVDVERLRPEDFHALDGVSVFRNISFSKASFNNLSGAVGFKINVLNRLLLDGNLIFALDHRGVRDKVTPLLGFEYSF
jgi:hypothetical protein